MVFPRTPSTSAPRMLPRLTALRAFAALFVFTYHMQLFGVAFHAHYPFSIGYTGVSFFFILSGFVLTWGGKEDSTRSNFYLRRFARIYPTYLAVLIIAWFFPFPSVPGHSIGQGLLAALLLQAWSSHNVATIYAVNPPSWSLSCEAFFYVGLPLYLPMLRRLDSRVRISGAVIAYGMLVAVAVHGSQWPASWSQYEFTYPLPRLAEFFIGVVTALELQAGRTLPRKIGMSVIALAVVISFVTQATFPIPDVALDPAWLGLIILAAQADIVALPGWLSTRWIVYAGEVSFAFYLVHQGTLLHMASHFGPGPLTALASLVIAACCAILLHQLIELPFQRAILTNLSKLRKRRLTDAGS